MHKLGVVLENVGPTQVTYDFLKKGIELVSNRFDVSLFLFFENLSRPILPPPFAMMNFAEIYGFEGTLITTTAYQTYQTEKYIGPQRRIFYSYDVEWVRHRKNLPVEFYNQVYRNTEVWARSEDHKKLIENCFNIEVKVNEDFNLEKFL